MSNKPTSENIARAMREAARIATQGTREERSGQFISTKPSIAKEVAPNKARA
jgi:hypothetical protein